MYYLNTISLLSVCLIANCALAANLKIEFLENPLVSQTTIFAGKSKLSLCQNQWSSKISLLPASEISKLDELLDIKKYDSVKLNLNLNNSDDLQKLKTEILLIKNLSKESLKVKISEKSLLAYAEMYNLASLALNTNTSIKDKESAIAHIHALAFAVNSQFLYPIPKSEWIIRALVAQEKRGAYYNTPACDVPSAQEDKGLIDPQNSILWKSMGTISKIDLKASVGSKSHYKLAGTNCSYDKKHSGFGIHPAFYVKCFDSSGKRIFSDSKIKIKFGNETHTGPFNSRIYTALGFHVEQADFFSELKVAYDRRIFTESNSSKLLKSELRTLLFGKITDIRLSGGDNPFENISYALLKNGIRISGENLAQFLLNDFTNLSSNILAYNYSQIHQDSNFKASAENEISYLVMKKGSFTLKGDNSSVELGAWEYNDMANAMRRDMRGLVVLSAFLGNYDIRWDNTKISLVKTSAGYELRQGLSDIGSGLGKAENLQFSNANISSFPSHWIHAGPQSNAMESNNPWDRDPAVVANGFRFLNFQTNLPNKTFEYISKSDAQWMARKIAQLQPLQLKEALLVSGFSNAEAEQFLTILLARKDNLLKALKL